MGKCYNMEVYKHEKRRENNRCKIISRFECKGKEMITIRINNTAHVMTYDEWRKIYGMNH